MRKVLVVALGGSLALASSALAFHDAGVAHCNGCHTMHNSQDGLLVDPDSPGGNDWLLVDATPSDVCLSCHATGLGAVFGSDPLAPPTERGGGNFAFLKEDNLNDGHGGASNPIGGDAAGHNVNAPSLAQAADGTLGVAPGGTFPAAEMGCTSCHDPHGNESFRLLYGAGAVVQDGVATFLKPAPTAVGLSLFGPGESNTNHTAYQGGMSNWCGNCHGDFHNNTADLVHPSGQAMGGTIAGIYNRYNGTEDQAGAVQATAYLAAVPFDDAANLTNSTAGPTGSSQVMCLSCHRAHASSAPDAGRWDFSVTLLHEDGDESGSYEIPDPYASVNQRSLCNKCHNKDANDHIAP
ncbi:MAG: cytochrome c [Gemmatimonadota bacterium]|nr:MAG: cytochrome c [Gemmatimonadota bacterium]